MSYIIGIAGGSGSGKSTFAKRLYEQFPDDIALISCDNYYLPHDDISLEKRAALNYDSPDAFEFSLMSDQLKRLSGGEAIDCPQYDFSLHTRKKESIRIEPRPIILIDGILIFSNPELSDMMDMKIYVETDADERILRRLLRDVEQRGRDIRGIIMQYLTTVKPMHNMYVEPTKMFADIIINGGMNDVAFETVKAKIEKLLNIGGKTK